MQGCVALPLKQGLGVMHVQLAKQRDNALALGADGMYVGLWGAVDS